MTGLVLPLGLLSLLVLLAGLQYRWTGEVSRAEAERMETSLRASVRRFSEDVDGELARVFEAFHVADDEELADALTSWRRDEAHPDLVGTVYLDRDGALFEVGPSELRPVDWPADLASLREEEAAAPRRRPRGSRPPPFPLPVLSDSPPALLIPMRSLSGRWRGPTTGDRVLVRLSPEELSERIFPELAERFFTTLGRRDYDAVVVNAAGEPLWSTEGADPGAVVAHPDAEARLFSLGMTLRRFPMRETPSSELEPPPAPGPFREAARELFEGRWQLFLRHRSGSLDAAVERVRWRNLAVSFGVLGLLAVSVGLIVVSSRRNVELGNRKMEFVAGVSHELRTPLAVIRSAAQNLADGSVSRPDQVKRYGSLVEAESRRLESLVEEVLELAGIQSQTRRFRQVRVDLRGVVERALAECSVLSEEKGVELVSSLPDGELFVLGDPDALRRAVSNLVANAVKHGDGANRVDVAVERRGHELAVVVTDRGPGIEPSDLPHLFEAFYRGRRARDRQVPGSGLGLSLVERIARGHGGRVEAASELGKGSRFTLLLPAEATV